MPRFEEQGIKLAAISYDSEAILKFFADRHGIGFPLLADPHSVVIRAYGLFNAEAAGFFKGMARPGYFFSLMPQGLSRRSFSNRSIVDGIPGIA